MTVNHDVGGSIPPVSASFCAMPSLFLGGGRCLLVSERGERVVMQMQDGQWRASMSGLVHKDGKVGVVAHKELQMDDHLAHGHLEQACPAALRRL